MNNGKFKRIIVGYCMNSNTNIKKLALMIICHTLALQLILHLNWIVRRSENHELILANCCCRHGRMNWALFVKQIWTWGYFHRASYWQTKETKHIASGKRRITLKQTLNQESKAIIPHPACSIYIIIHLELAVVFHSCCYTTWKYASLKSTIQFITV